VSSLTRTSGQTDYRLVYIKNEHAVQSASVKAWISQQFGDVHFHLDIGAAVEAAGADVAMTDDRLAVPPGVVFSRPTDSASGINLGTIGPGQSKGLWLRRTIDAGAPDLASHPFSFSGEVTAL
jgi:hypothetical protein